MIVSSQYVWSEDDFLNGERWRLAFKPGTNLILNSNFFFQNPTFHLRFMFWLVIAFYSACYFSFTSSVIRQKGESQNGCFKKTKQAKFSRACVRIRGVSYVSFSENFVGLLFLKTPVLRFTLLPYYRRLIWSHKPSPFHLSLFCKKRAFKFQIYWSLTMCYMSI